MNQMNITFIAKPIFFRAARGGGVYPARLSSRIRGEEIAEYLGGIYSTDGTYDKGGIRIHLKPRSLRRVKDGDYVDIIDAIYLIPELKKRPKVKVLAYNIPYYEFLKGELENELIYIPHPHINFENKKRVRNKALVGGIVGKSTKESYISYNAIKASLAKVGIEFKECFRHETKQDMLDFYDQIDFQVIWYEMTPTDATQYFRYPGKIVNAAAFGIPTIAQNIIGHKEFEGYYLGANTYEDCTLEAVKLKDGKYYNQLSKRLIKKAKEFHISKIAKLYKQLR